MFKNKTCVFCGNPAASGDHVPPKGIFVEPLHNINLEKVPACLSCNNGTSKEDFLFQINLALLVNNQTPEAVQYWKQSVRKLNKPENKKIKTHFQDRVRGAIPLNQSKSHYQINFPINELRPVLEKMTKGLYYKITQKIMPKDISIEISEMNQYKGFNQEAYNSISNHLKTKEIYPGVFTYAFGVTNDKEGASIGYYRFYETFFVTIITGIED
jgi:hypothetical protein